MINVLNQYAPVWASYFGLAMLQNTIFIGLVFLALAILRNTSAHLKYLVTLMGLLKLLIPPFWNVVFFIDILPWSIPGDRGITSIAFGEILPLTSQSTTGLSLFGWIFGIWLNIALTFILVPVITTAIYQKKLSIGTAPYQEVLRNNDRKSILIYQTDRTSLPLSSGLFYRRIYLPMVHQSWSHECRQAVLQHEIAHIRRLDGIIQILQLVAQGLYFFHPLVWLLNAKMHEYREMACDDFAVRTTNLSPLEYAKFLTHIARQVICSGLAYTSISTLIRQKNKLLNRVKYQITEEPMKRKSSKARISVVWLALLLLLIPLSWYCSSNQSSEETILKSDSIVAADAAEHKFQLYDSEPKPMGGFKAIQANLKYPENARKAGIEGRVVVQVLINEQGKAEQARIGQSCGNNECDQAAISAIQSVQWKPAVYQNQPVTVWINIPVEFKLDGTKQRTNKVPAPPPAEPEAPDELVPYDEPPAPMGGFEAIVKNLHYPELARKTGIQGKVIVNTQIDETGKVTAAKIQQSLGENNGCDAAAMAAIKATQWRPAKQDGKPVKVWISIPIIFQLK